MFHLIVATITAVIALYIGVRLIRPLPLSGISKLLLAIACLLMAESLVLVRLFMGSAGTWNLSREAMLLAGFGQLLTVLLFLLTLGRDLAILPFALAARLRGVRFGLVAAATGRHATLVLLCGASLLSGWGVREALKVPSVHELHIPVRDLPEELDGLRVAHLSDLHISPVFPRSWLHRIVDRTNALNPDLTLITGDISDGPVRRLGREAAPLGALRARYGVFLVQGNHEYVASCRDWMRFFRELGLRVLINEHELIRVNGTPLVIAGVPDPVAVRMGERGPDLQRTFAGAPADAFRLLLAHRPAGAAASREAGVDLQLSGHTHGGQILPLQTLAAHFNEGYVNGLYDVNGMPLYVHPGCGLWPGMPVRLGVPSQIALLILHRASEVAGT